MSHTEGPWRLKTFFSSFTKKPLSWDLISADGTELAIIDRPSGEPIEPYEEIAHLLKAAPDLLLAAQIAIDAFNEKECNCDGEYVDGRLVGHACYFHRIENVLKHAIEKAGEGKNVR